jgi:hypothetical protein
MSKRKTTSHSYSVGSLDFRSGQQSQNVIEQQYLHEVPSITALPRDTTDNAPIDFRVDKTDHYLDLNETYVYMKMNIVHADETSLAESEYVSTVNNLAYSMWNSVEVYVNDNKITADNTFYPWMSYIHFLTKCPNLTGKLPSETGLWFDDEAGNMEWNDFTKPDVPVNLGSKERSSEIAGSKSVELYWRLMLDFVGLQQLLPSNIELLVRFIPANANLSLLHEIGNQVKIRIQQARLYVGKVRLTKFALNHYNQLLSKGNFRYTTRRYVTRTRMMQKNEQNVDWISFSALRRPRRLYVWQISQAAYNANPTRNIFNLQYKDMDRFQLYCNEQSYPANVPWKAGEGDINRMYLSTVRAINNPEAWNVDLESFTKGFFLIVVDITKDQSAEANYESTQTEATVRLIIDYREPLSEPWTIFCMCEYTSIKYAPQDMVYYASLKNSTAIFHETSSVSYEGVFIVNLYE